MKQLKNLKEFIETSVGWLWMPLLVLILAIILQTTKVEGAVGGLLTSICVILTAVTLDKLITFFGVNYSTLQEDITERLIDVWSSDKDEVLKRSLLKLEMLAFSKREDMRIRFRMCRFLGILVATALLWQIM